MKWKLVTVQVFFQEDTFSSQKGNNSYNMLQRKLDTKRVNLHVIFLVWMTTYNYIFKPYSKL